MPEMPPDAEPEITSDKAQIEISQAAITKTSEAPAASETPAASAESASRPLVPAVPGQPAGLHRIVLTGFMGAGKTTVGLLLARHLSWRFLDVDAEIEASAGASVAQLFAGRGELWFRQLEHETIRRLLSPDSRSGPLVLALGGGAIEDTRTRSLLLASEATRLVHLEASLETVLKRCDGTGPVRPLLQDRLNLENRYLQRLPLYRQSHHTIAVDALSPEAVVRAILDSLSAGIPAASR